LLCLRSHRYNLLLSCTFFICSFKSNIDVYVSCFFSQLEPGKYVKGVQWLRELLFNTRLTAERLQLVAAKMANDVAQAKRQGNKVAGALLKGLLYKKGDFTIMFLKFSKFNIEFHVDQRAISIAPA
jgi:hypothetical protein